MIQSWQTDLLNLQLSLTVKPMFKYIGSVDHLRALVRLSDGTLGRFSIPRGTRREDGHHQDQRRHNFPLLPH